MDPLSNPLILSNIFEQLSLDEKKSFREVSLLWEHSTLPSWRDNALVKIEKERIETNSDSSSDSSTSEFVGITLQEFVELLKGDTEPYRFSETKPFRNFQLHGCPFYCPPYKTKGAEWLKDTEITQPLVESLFEKIGPTIHHLQLDFSVKIGSGRFIDAFKWILLKACVNLKALHIDPTFLIDNDRSEPPLQPEEFVQEKALNLVTLRLAEINFSSIEELVPNGDVQEFWNIIPNLKNLDIYRNSFALELIEPLKHPLSSGKFIQLERLKLQTYFADFMHTSEVEQLEEMTKYILAANPPLTKVYLNLNLGKLRRAQDSFKAFLESCKDTLTSLSVLLLEQDIDNQPEPKDWIIELSGVTLPNLTCLYVDYMCQLDSDDEEELTNEKRNFDFGALRGFPKLKKLTVQLCGFREIIDGNLFRRQRWLTEEELQYGNAEEHSGDNYPVRNELMEDFTFRSFLQFDLHSLQKLASWMPSIKCLAVDVSQSTLPVILNSFPKLKRLSLLSGSSVSDEEEVKKTYPGIEFDMLDFNESYEKCKMPEYF